MAPDDVAEIKGAVSRIEVALGRIEEKVKASDEKVSDLENAVFGNGKPGLMSDVADMKGKVLILWNLLQKILPYVVGAGGIGAALTTWLSK
jgi:hypothetical protein